MIRPTYVWYMFIVVEQVIYSSFTVYESWQLTWNDSLVNDENQIHLGLCYYWCLKTTTTWIWEVSKAMILWYNLQVSLGLKISWNSMKVREFF